MSKEESRVYITKYALSQGIYIQKGILETDTDDKVMFIVNGNVFYHNDDFQLTLEEAKKNFEERLAKEITKTEKKLARLKTITFEKALRKEKE